LDKKAEGNIRIWLHASSVGEVQAARALIPEIRRLLPGAGFVLSTMTAHGRRVAEKFLGEDVSCVLAPLDVPFIVERGVAAIDPDLYICIETEIWPLILKKISQRRRPLVLVNGRMSESSYGGYRKIRGFMARILSHFTQLAVISLADGERYIDLGVDRRKIQVLGNVKCDLALPPDQDAIHARYRSLLAIESGCEVLIAGSTHGKEEEELLPYLDAGREKGRQLLILAPRHIERLPQLRQMLEQKGYAFDLFSDLEKGRARQADLVLVDCMGELAMLYSVADYVFCGGSLVPRGGHNVMEIALWNRAVFYGPHMSDYRDATRMLEEAGAGFMVRDGLALKEKIEFFREHEQEYHLACIRAGELARSQQGAARKQAEMVVSLLQ
jgi:3-deoxy-D-manno-octulosonic-acid transferase